MTSQKAQIQTLIDEIDGVLSKASPRLPWVMSGDMEQQRRVLEETRNYLVSLQQNAAASALSPALGGFPPLSQPAPLPMGPSAGESAQQVLQAVLQEVSYLRSSVMQPLRSDIEGMQQKREALAQEIRLLEAQRQQYALPQQQANQQQIVAEFLQSLMGRLQENLTGQVAQMLVNMEAQMQSDRALSGGAASGSLPSYTPMLSPTQRLEHLQMVQAQSDQLLLKLDSTLRVIFESLQSNVQSYQDSLGLGLDKMHSLGQQGEAMFAALVNRLAQQLGREASTYLQSSIETTDWGATSPLPGSGAAAGTPAPARPAVSSEISDSAIDSFMNQPSSDNLSAASAETLELLDLELSNIALETDPAQFNRLVDVDDDDDDNLTVFQTNQPFTTIQSDDDDLTFFQLNEDITRIQTDLEELTSIQGSTSLQSDQAEDLDSALNLLNQLTSELQAGEATPEAAEENFDEVDELYETLFGMAGSSAVDDDQAIAPADQHIADAASLEAALTEASFADSSFADASFPEAADQSGLAELVGLGDDDATLELQEGLFGGLADANSIDDDLLPEDEFNESAARSLEQFLFADDAESADSDLGAESDTDASERTMDRTIDNAPAIAPTVDTISSLAELIGAPEPEPIPESTETLHLDGSIDNEDEDGYIPAAPDETLLVSEGTEAVNRGGIPLPSDALQQLTADLSSLEGLDQDEIGLPSYEPVNSDSDWAIADLNVAEEIASVESRLNEVAPLADAADAADLFPSFESDAETDAEATEELAEELAELSFDETGSDSSEFASLDELASLDAPDPDITKPFDADAFVDNFVDNFVAEIGRGSRDDDDADADVDSSEALEWEAELNGLDFELDEAAIALPDESFDALASESTDEPTADFLEDFGMELPPDLVEADDEDPEMTLLLEPPAPSVPPPPIPQPTPEPTPDTPLGMDDLFGEPEPPSINAVYGGEAEGLSTDAIADPALLQGEFWGDRPSASTPASGDFSTDSPDFVNLPDTVSADEPSGLELSDLLFDAPAQDEETDAKSPLGDESLDQPESDGTVSEWANFLSPDLTGSAPVEAWLTDEPLNLPQPTLETPVAPPDLQLTAEDERFAELSNELSRYETVEDLFMEPSLGDDLGDALGDDTPAEMPGLTLDDFGTTVSPPPSIADGNLSNDSIAAALLWGDAPNDDAAESSELASELFSMPDASVPDASVPDDSGSEQTLASLDDMFAGASDTPAPEAEPVSDYETLAGLFATDEPDSLFEEDTAPLEELTLDDFSAAVPSPTASGSEGGDEADAFTLEGLDSLFNDVPDAVPTTTPEQSFEATAEPEELTPAQWLERLNLDEALLEPEEELEPPNLDDLSTETTPNSTSARGFQPSKKKDPNLGDGGSSGGDR